MLAAGQRRRGRCGAGGRRRPARCRHAAALRHAACAPASASSSRSTVPCSSTPARTRASTCSRLARSRMTLSMPMPASNWPSSRPDGPEPMMATCVRSHEPRLSIWPASSSASRKRGRRSRPPSAAGSAIRASRRRPIVPARGPAPGASRKAASALKRASADQHLGRHRIALVRHGRRPAAAGQRDLACRLAPSARCPGRTCRGCRSPATASRRIRRGRRAGCAIAARRQGRAGRRAPCARAGPLSPSLSSVPAAPPNCTTSSGGDCSRQPLRDAARAARRQAAMRSETRIGIAGCMRVTPISAVVAEARARVAAKRPISSVEPAVETRDDRLQPQHQRGVDDILAGGAEMHLCAMRLADACAHLPHQFGHHDAVAAPRRPAARPYRARTWPAPRRSLAPPPGR